MVLAQNMTHNLSYNPQKKHNISRVGDSVKTRVVGLDRCAGLAICTLHKNLVSGAASIDELSIGN